MPGDVDSDGAVCDGESVSDIAALLGCLNNPGSCTNYRADINHSGAQNAQDITTLINVMIGANKFIVWLGRTTPEQPTACTPEAGAGCPSGDGFSGGAPGQADAVPASLAGELLVYLMEAKPCGSEELGQLQEMAGVFAQWCRESCPHDARDALVAGLTNPARVYADSEVAEIARGLATALGE